MAKKIVADSGFWFALFNERDTHHDEAQVIEEELSFHVIVVPWPTLYESINTRFIRRHHNLVRFRKFLEKSSTVLLEDDLYRKASLDFILTTDAIKKYSLVDHVVRSMLADPRISVDAMISFNPRDFCDVCDSRGIEMLYR